VRIIQAQKINQVTGAALMPWEIEEMPGEWMDAILAMADELREMQAARKQVDSVKQKLLKDIRKRNHG
jgi:glycogen debranching enzyme